MDAKTVNGMIQFFRTAPLDTADLVLGLCEGEVKVRREKSDQAKVRAGSAPAGGTKGKKRGPRKKGPQPVATPAVGEGGEPVESVAEAAQLAGQ